MKTLQLAQRDFQIVDQLFLRERRAVRPANSAETSFGLRGSNRNYDTAGLLLKALKSTVGWRQVRFAAGDFANNPRQRHPDSMTYQHHDYEYDKEDDQSGDEVFHVRSGRHQTPNALDISGQGKTLRKERRARSASLKAIQHFRLARFYPPFRAQTIVFWH